ncbi:MAG: Recombinase [Clostridia bacterium]|jgi:DNA invertase Pin-like site-specific DNA recombinase|nr:Recombinase [Clostridia bacterium]
MIKDYTITSTKVYKVGAYVRLSREDEDTNNFESQSITNQKEFLTSYVLENGWNLVNIYSDDGYSGTNFNRPGFEKLIEDIESGLIDMVITKDLSRFGRDYITTGYYLEKYFPEKRIRYIAINDGIDTAVDNTSNDMTPFRAVFNDMYAKDISKKVRTSLKTKQIKGEYLGTTAPYGYNKDKESKGKLVIDEESSVYVKRIFREFLSGKSINSIKDGLIRDSLQTPSGYRRIKNSQKWMQGVWCYTTIVRILKNEAYIGHTIQNKKQKISYKVKKQIDIPRINWIKVENTHEPIISLGDFNKVQKILQNRSYIPNKGKPHLLSGLLFCGQCGARVTFLNRYEKGKFNCKCIVAKNNNRLNLCDMKPVKEENIEFCLRKALVKLSKEYVDVKDIKNVSCKSNIDKLIDTKKSEKSILENKLSDSKKIHLNLYKDKVAGIINETEFLEFTKQLNEEKENCENRITELSKEIVQLKGNNINDSKVETIIKEFLQFKKLDRNIVRQLVNRITIYNDNKLEIEFAFSNPEIIKLK